MLGLLPLLAGCAPEPATVAFDLLETPRERSWLPAAPPETVILALHGFNDYSNAFDEFGSHAAGRGVAVYAFDQRGFGANADAGYWPGAAALIEGLRERVEELRAAHPEARLFLLGESMGAAVVMAAMTAPEPPEVDGLVLSAPAVWGGEQLNPVYRATLWLAGRVVPDLRLTGQGLKRQASDNIEMLRALGADPLVIKATRVAAISGLVRLMDRAYAAAARLEGPLLILGGARDEIVPPDALSATLDRIEASPCHEIIYPDGWHLLLRDQQRHVVFEDVLAWLEGAPPPSGLDRPCGADLTQDAAWRS
ncbi:MAG TPA: alpha/beta hydrolase [Geminicoccaceae bacterium]